MRYRLFMVPLLVSVITACARTVIVFPIAEPEPEQVVALPGPVVVVAVTYPGADAMAVAETVAARMEQQINGVAGMTRIESESGDGACTIHVHFEPKTDVNEATTLVRNRVALAQPMLPDACKVEGIHVGSSDPNRFPGAWVTVTGADAVVLGDVAERVVRNELLRVPGITAVRVVGASAQAMRVWLDPEKLAARGLTVQDVVKAVQHQNVQVAAGHVGQEPALAGQSFQLTITTLGRLADAEQYNNIVVKTGDDSAPGTVIRLKDVARIELGSQTDGYALLNGKPAVVLAIHADPGKPLSMVVREALGKIEHLPKGVTVELAVDSSAPGLTLVELRSPDAASRIRTRAYVEQAVKLLRELPGSPECVAFSGREPNVATILVKPLAKDGPTPADIRKALAEIKEAAVRVSDLSSGRPFPVQVALADTGAHGDAKLREWANDVARRLADEGVALDPGVFPGNAVPRLAVHLDRTKMAALCVAASDVTATLQANLGVTTVNDFDGLGRSWGVRLELENPRTTADDLNKLKIRTRDGELVSLAAFVEIREGTSPPVVLRVNRYPALRLTADVQPGKTVAEVLAKCVAVAEAAAPGKGYRVFELGCTKAR